MGAMSGAERDDVELTFCVVNTSQRELLLRGLDAIARERAALPFATEVLVLDNGSRDGSAEAARAHPAVDEHDCAPRAARQGAQRQRAAARARGRYACSSTRTRSCCRAPRSRSGARSASAPARRCAGAQLLRPDGTPQACAWRFPGPVSALAGALFLARLIVVQSRGERTRDVDWCQSSALLVRRDAAAEVGYLDPDFFVYSDEVDFARGCAAAGWRSVYVPAARAIHHEQLSTGVGARAADRRTGPRPRPLHAQAPLARRPRARCAG